MCNAVVHDPGRGEKESRQVRGTPDFCNIDLSSAGEMRHPNVLRQQLHQEGYRL